MEGTFAYRNANTDAIALVVAAVALGGLGEFARRTLAGGAGLERRSMYFAARDGVALAYVFFYAPRLDWLRIAVRIGEEARSGGCIYLRKAGGEPSRSTSGPTPIGDTGSSSGATASG